VFLYSENDLDINSLLKSINIYKILQYDSSSRQLLGEDLEYADWIYRNNGAIRPSRVLEISDEIKVVDGPLLNCTGKIIRLDKHKRRAIVEFKFDGIKRQISLTVECISQTN